MDRAEDLSGKQFRRLSEEEQLAYIERRLEEDVQIWMRWLRQNPWAIGEFFSTSRRGLVLITRQR